MRTKSVSRNGLLGCGRGGVAEGAADGEARAERVRRYLKRETDGTRGSGMRLIPEGELANARSVAVKAAMQLHPDLDERSEIWLEERITRR